MLCIRLRVVRSLKMRKTGAYFFRSAMKRKNFFQYFSIFEWLLWALSVTAIITVFCIFDKTNYLSLVASLLGATSLVFCAKGNPIGQVLMIIFSLLYGYISFQVRYYGEMLTYLGMTLPMAIIALISWLKNPYKGNRSEVKINRLRGKEIALMFLLAAAVTVLFYFLLKLFGTANLIPSALSVTTSFIAAYLTFRRSPFFALAYAANDVVLLVLWILIAVNDLSTLSVVVCFAVFLVNDLYGFFNWLRMQKRQSA